MNYQILKQIIDIVLKNFSCPECNSKLESKDVEILGTGGNGINLDMYCPNCKKHTFVKTQFTQIPINLKDIKFPISKKEIVINDKEIVDLSKILKKQNLGVDDLFSN